MSDIVSTAMINRPTDRESWLRAKNDWIGASEVASLFCDASGEPLGFDSPLTLLKRKAGLQAAVDRPDLEIYADMEIGMLRRWEKLHPERGHAYLNGYQDVYHQPGHERLRATPDAIIGEAERLVQFKVTGDSLASWSSGPPLKYLVQVQAEMFCSSAPACDLYALFRCERPHMVDKVWEVEEVPEFQREIASRVEAFWQLVEEWRAGDTRRLPTLSSDDGAALAPLISGRKADVVMVADEALAGVALRWETVKEQASSYSSAGEGIGKVEKLLRHQLIGAMGDASILVLPDGRRLRARSIERAPYEVQGSAWVELAVVKSKKEIQS